MIEMPSFELQGGSSLCLAISKRHGIATFGELAARVQAIPYGRPEPADSVLAVLEQNRGTCSSKHRLLAQVALDCGHPEIELAVGVYEMSEDNTPGVGAVLREASIPSIPEAHCYLIVGGVRFDFTGVPAGASSPFDTLLLEQVVVPDELVQTKARLHRQALEAWAAGHDVPFDFAWATREACIAALAASHRAEPHPFQPKPPNRS